MLSAAKHLLFVRRCEQRLYDYLSLASSWGPSGPKACPEPVEGDLACAAAWLLFVSGHAVEIRTGRRLSRWCLRGRTPAPQVSV